MKKTINALLALIISSFFAIHAAEQRFELPIQYKLHFDGAVAAKNIDTIVALLTSERSDLEELRNRYPLAMKLYRILTEFSPGEDFTREARYIPIQAIAYVAKELAIEGGNDLFLKNMPR
jgi:hypothetical protein